MTNREKPRFVFVVVRSIRSFLSTPRRAKTFRHLRGWLLDETGRANSSKNPSFSNAVRRVAADKSSARYKSAVAYFYSNRSRHDFRRRLANQPPLQRVIFLRCRHASRQKSGGGGCARENTKERGPGREKRERGEGEKKRNTDRNRERGLERRGGG